MRKKKRKYALITGASSGIGREFARQLSDKGYIVILTARRRERLLELKRELFGKSHIIVADLQKTGDIDRIFDAIKDISISVFINNAGFGYAGEFDKAELKKDMDMVDVNIKAMHIMFKRMLIKMEEQGHGAILNVASSAGLMPSGPYMATYYATKAYVASLSYSVAEELSQKHSRVYVASLCPGPVDTEFDSVAGVSFSLQAISPQQCVKSALFWMRLRKRTIIPGAVLNAGAVAIRFIPRRMAAYIMSRQQRKKL